MEIGSLSNELFQANYGCSLVLYTDVTTLYKPIPNLLSDFQSHTNIIHNWFSSNHLTANTAKTKFIVISTKKDPFPDVSMHLNNHPIEQVSSAKFHGILVSSNHS